MIDPVSSSLTGSECGAPPTHTEPVSRALGRLRGMVVACCWIAGAALLAQMIIWAVVTLTDVRWRFAEPATAPLIVGAEAGGSTGRRISPFDEPVHEAAAPAVDPNRVLSPIDGHLRLGAGAAAATATLAVLALLPLIALAAQLAVASATAGVERVVSAFAWGVLVTILVLPALRFLDLPWRTGALWSYAELVRVTDARGAGEFPTVPHLARHVMLPLACITGLMIVGAQISAGVAAGLMRREQLALDPALEQETAGIRPGSLHASRAALALDRATRQVAETAALVAAQPSAPGTGAGATAPPAPSAPLPLAAASARAASRPAGPPQSPSSPAATGGRSERAAGSGARTAKKPLVVAESDPPPPRRLI